MLLNQVFTQWCFIGWLVLKYNDELRSDRLENVYPLFRGIDFKLTWKLKNHSFSLQNEFYCSCTYRMVGAVIQWWVEWWVVEFLCFLLLQVLCCWNLSGNIHKESKFGHTSFNIDIKQNHHSALLEGFNSPRTWVFSVYVIICDFLFCLLTILVIIDNGFYLFRPICFSKKVWVQYLCVAFKL